MPKASINQSVSLASEEFKQPKKKKHPRTKGGIASAKARQESNGELGLLRIYIYENIPEGNN